MRRSALVLAAVLACASTAAAAPAWQKYVAADQSFSFHYPAGWAVKAEESVVEVTNAPADEQLLIVAMPYDAKRSAVEHAKGMVALFRREMPDLEASGWSTPEGARNVAFFDVAYTDKGKPYLGTAIVIKTDGRAHWFSYSGPAQGYSKPRGAGLLQQVLSSVAAGAASRPPQAAAQASATRASPAVERNARAFLFVLEFALGAPLTSAQEALVLAELKKSWSEQTPQELEKFDAYPKFVDAILSANQQDLEKIRSALEETVREWLDESDASDPSVAAIRAQLAKRGKVLIAGDPPLTEMAAGAYSELMAYSELLHRNPKATPEQVSPKFVAEIRKQLLDAWGGFSEKDRRNIATAPAVWMAQRTLIERGTREEQANARAQLAKLTPAPSAASTTGSAPRPRSWAEHNVLMQMQQQTFNTYMWSRGFSGWTPMGKMY